MSRHQDLRFVFSPPNLVPDTFRGAGRYKGFGPDDGPLISHSGSGNFSRLDGPHVGAAQNERGRDLRFPNACERTLDFIAATFGEFTFGIRAAWPDVLRCSMPQQVNAHSLDRKISCGMTSRVVRILFTVGLLTICGQAQPRIAGCAVFPANNIWNTPIDKLPVDANSGRYVSTIGATQPAHADFGSGLWDGGPIGIPFVDVPGTQAKVTVKFDYDDESDHAGYPIPANVPIEGGAASSGDRHVLVVDHDNCILYELYSAYPQPDGSWQAGSGAIFDLKANTLRPAGWTSADAAGLPITSGLVRYDETAAGEIDHAIRFTAPQTRTTYVWPARHYASDLSAIDYPPMGQRFRLKVSFDVSSFSTTVQVILRALKKYGMILADNGSSWYLSGAPDERWDNDALHEISRLQGSDFEAVDEASLMADPNSGRVSTSSVPAVTAVVNAGSFVAGAVSPGEIVSIFGSGFSADTSATKVYFDSTAAPLLYTSPGQINAVVPYEIAAQASTNMHVEINGVASGSQTLAVASAAPGIFIVLNQDYSINSAARPAARESAVIVYATGEGQTNPAGVDGKIADTVWPKPVDSVSASVAGADAKVLYAGAAPFFIAGAMQINVKLPAGLAAGTVAPLVVSVGAFHSQTVMIAVR